MQGVKRSSSVLVTGAAGYIGSTLVRQLLSRGDRVVAVDRMFFGEEALADLHGQPRFRLFRMDIADLTQEHLVGIDAVVDLAALSNDMAGEIDPLWTERVNHLARVRLAQRAREAGVQRYVMISSASVYGRSGTSDVSESCPVDPLTTYASTAVKAELGVLREAHKGLDAAILRLGTVYGRSYRMRFDVVVNTMVLNAIRRRVIQIHGSGLQWRPHVHVADVGRAIQCCLDAPPARIVGEIFNIAHSNIRIKDVALSVRDALRERVCANVDVVPCDGPTDVRNYRLNLEKSHGHLGFAPTISIEEASLDLGVAIASGAITDAPHTYTAKWYERIRFRHGLAKVEGLPLVID